MSEPIVTHSQLGEAQLLRTLDNGQTWEVRFLASGRRYRLPAAQFDNTAHSSPEADDQLMRFRHRQALEALRLGIVPLEEVKQLTIGLESEQLTLSRALDRSTESGGDALAVLADYGFGKSHFIEIAAQNARQKNFIVASTSLDLIEVPPGKAREIYKALIGSLRYPDTDERGLGYLLRRALDRPEVVHQFIGRSTMDDDPLVAALSALSNCDDAIAQQGIIDWISGAVNTLNDAAKTYLKHPPRLYLNGEVARQYTYLLTGISVLAVLLGYAGMAVLIDESEHYTLLRGIQHDRADSFFKSMIYAATGSDNQRINIDTIPNHLRADYPLIFSDPTHLFFLFASTDVENQRLPVEQWLAPTQIMRLDGRFIKKDVLIFAKNVLTYHGIAYRYAPPEMPYKQLLETSATDLSTKLRESRITLRQLIRLTVTLCDLMFTYPDYPAQLLLDELARGLT